MCELLGVSTVQPVHLRYSLEEFARHGGSSHINRSGWGVAYYEDNDVLRIREASPAATSPWIDFLETNGLTSRCTICHVRYASVGEQSIVNTHPFVRELGGRMHVFAHNGSLLDFETSLPFESDMFRPVGQTDSEHAFCVLMQRLAPLWAAASGSTPSLEARVEIVVETARQFRSLGTANFLYADGEVLFAHAHRRRFDVDGAFGEVRPPGLCVTRAVRFAEALHMSPSDMQSDGMLVASVPLSDEGWEPLDEGTVIAFRDGFEVARADP